ncbi:hypothetical protein DIE15_08450 [Burkholderia sp. Bp9031]|uniref:baseplate J/gp47 family protein n=1 Tax=Burkholderia sp. Bp9031 TaxID=2184566 RepID=UPI000F5D835A|nr:baseplate J/gp47 family protein [Burkholderia sp. Bp9031]RQZ18148.1 hypothetical protein DIE15_08450 [Burkholderia sp. Bp9031]
MGQLTPQGYVAERLDAILTRMEAGLRRIYGEDIDLSPDSPDAQAIGLFAQGLADINELGAAIYRALDPDYAGGKWLEQRVAYAGLKKRGARYSRMSSVILLGTPHRTIPAGAVVSDPQRVRWQLIRDVVLNAAGAGRGDFQSEERGAFTNPIGTTLKIETIVSGWDSATTFTATEAGAPEELDGELRARFARSRARPAQNSAETIEAKLDELDDVREVICLENWTDATDANGVPPRSINVIVDGGDDATIAQIIFDNKTSGTGMRGDVEYFVRDRKGRQRKILFDRPRIRDCAAYLQLKRDRGQQAIDEDAIKKALAGYRYSIGQDVALSRLYTPVNTVPGFTIETFNIGFVDGVMLPENLTIGPRERARFLPENIEIIPL